MNTKVKSRRQELKSFVDSGQLRQMAEMHSRMSEEAVNLLVDIVLRYTE